MDQIEGEQRMTQVVEDPEEQHDVELLPELLHVVDRDFSNSMSTPRISAA